MPCGPRGGRVPVIDEYLRLIDTSTSPRYDITPLFGDPAAFRSLVQDLSAHFRGRVEVVAGIDAADLILGAAIALSFRERIRAERKGGKFSSPVDSVSFIDYSGRDKTLEIRQKSLIPGARVLVVDDWIETGPSQGRHCGSARNSPASSMESQPIRPSTGPTDRLVGCHWLWQEPPTSWCFWNLVS